MRFCRRSNGVVIAFVLAFCNVVAGVAQTAEVTQVVHPGTPTYSVSSAVLHVAAYSEEEQYSEGTLVVSMNGFGDTDGWTLSVQATSPLIYAGNSLDAADIPAENLLLFGAGAPEYVAGQEINGTHGPKVLNHVGSLATPLSVLVAEPRYGAGSYTQILNVSLRIPAYSQVGTYTGEITVVMTSFPTIEE